jgi:DNA-binding Lrp family transcriptional regulator
LDAIHWSKTERDPVPRNAARLEKDEDKKKLKIKNDREKAKRPPRSPAPKTKRKSSLRKNRPLEPTDRVILNEIQRNFPLTHRPYLALARKLNLAEVEMLERVKRLKAEGIIRRIGASFSSGAVGFSSTLCAARVPRQKIDGFIAVVNSYPGVTHNYERHGTYNIWFTLIASSKSEIQRILDEIARRTGVTNILNLPARKTFKIAVDFNFD